MLHLWLPEQLCTRLQPKETSEKKSTNALPNRTKKRLKPRQYEQQPREKNEQNEITACISLEGDVLPYFALKFPNNQQNALIDTGANPNAIIENQRCASPPPYREMTLKENCIYLP